MPSVHFSRHLQHLLKLPPTVACAGVTVADLVHRLEAKYPGLASYLVHENGTLRQHVNIFIGQQWVRDRAALSDPLKPTDEVSIFPALSGG